MLTPPISSLFPRRPGQQEAGVSAHVNWRSPYRALRFTAFALTCLLAASVASVEAQQFELRAPGGGGSSFAELTGSTLRVEDQAGNVTIYDRAARFDSADGEWLGYVSAAARQTIRWPRAGRGNFQIARSVADSQLAFRPSQMEIRPLGNNRPAPVDPGGAEAIDPRMAYRIVPVLREHTGRTLAIGPDSRLTLHPIAEDDSQAWHLTTLAPGLVRLHLDARGRRWSLSTAGDDRPQLVPTDDQLDQLWRMVPVADEPGTFLLARLDGGGPGGGGGRMRVLSCPRSGQPVLLPRDWSATQRWRLVPIAARLPAPFAQYVFRSRELRPNPALPPAKVELTNSHSKELWVLLFDRQQRSGGQRLKIPAGKAHSVVVQRDPGATLVEIYERTSPLGVVEREELVTPLPPEARYDVSVYELIVQSVAIDSTVKGGKLEDVQYAPKSLGWFELPPGDLLPDGPLDVYSAAKDQRNPGQVRRLQINEWRSESPTPDPVESVLRRFKK